jgi:hypothetical protein
MKGICIASSKGHTKTLPTNIFILEAVVCAERYEAGQKQKIAEA